MYPLVTPVALLTDDRQFQLASVFELIHPVCPSIDALSSAKPPVRAGKGRQGGNLANSGREFTAVRDKATATGFVGTRVEQMTVEELIKLRQRAGWYRVDSDFAELWGLNRSLIPKLTRD